MYLKSIEVQGFKSFANKMKFQFHNGITGIVGPNGSGKSNVADAVRWVLGEQSAKQLRGSNMQDVIFAGTENRKPLGFAAVAITLDNADHQLPADYEEVTVTRRLYRSGESEYLLNGTPCRLRDIQEMFYDTGIGKEGYSIIGQGQIEKILNGKPEERRELFDEAAGIVKYKRRKMTAQKKLESETNNLTRVNDILAEITRQIGPLEKQSEKAKIYLQKKEELKKLDINLFLLDVLRIQGQLKEVEDKIAISDSDLAEAKTRLQRAREEYETAQRQLGEANRKIEEKQETIHQGAIVREQMESQVKMLRQEISFAKQNEEQFAERLTSLEADAGNRAKQIDEEKSALAALKEELLLAKEAECENTKEQERLNGDAHGLQQQIAAGQAELIELLNQRSTTKSKLQRYDTMKEQMQIRGAELNRRLLEAKGEEEDLAQNKASLQEEYDAVVRTIGEMAAGNSAVEEAIQNIQTQLAEKNRELEETQAAYHREESRLESLRNITERYDGYGNSIRRVMEQKEQTAGLHGVVADLIRTQKKYETAIETALGGSIQNIVTDNEHTAKRMIDFLKQNRYGRATFLPLTAIRRKGGLAKEQALYEPGAIGVASTLVDADEQYDTLVEYLLGQTLVADDIDHAIAIARKYKHAIRIVTLDGELLSPGGSMSGGAYKNSSNLLGRRREAAELEKSIKRLKEKTEDIRAQIEELREKRGAYRQELQERTEKMQQQYLRQNTAKLKLGEIEEQKSRTLSDHAQIRREAGEIENRLREIGGEQEAIRAELETSRRTEEELEQRITQDQEKLEETRRLAEEQTEKAAEAKARTAGIVQRREFMSDNIERLVSELASLTEEQQKLQENRRDSETDTARKNGQIERILESLEQARQDEERTREEMEELQEQRRKLSEVHRNFFTKHEELSGALSALDKERFRLDNQKERLEDYRERQIGYMWEEYQITASEAEAYRDGTQNNAAQLKKRVGELKNEIRALGPVNVNAIEEYKETSKRYEFLSAQHEDLVKAGDALKDVIRELDAGMRRQFMEKFALMQTEFSKSFKELFGGGRGTLELVEDEDILEAGIRITAQPPGKKLQNMMQMSGGEKALTAIALLFAIQNMKPSPFCLLDEIEAALDENNVSRYANYLKKLTKYTQFIIITHRRGTMAAADRLYGITMQEKGISTQVSVNMVEDELDK